MNDAAAPTDVVVCAAGAMPGDLHKLWRTRDPKGYHVEYGYSCMGYEIAGGIGVKLAAPEREVVVLVGDGSYLMMPGELVTAVQERLKLTVVLVDNHGFNSIGGLSRSLGLQGFGTQYRYVDGGRPVLDDDDDPPPTLPLDLAANAASLGARAERVGTIPELRDALARARDNDGVSVIVVEVDRYEGVPSYESWWDVPVAEVSELPAVQAARREYEEARRAERRFLTRLPGGWNAGNVEIDVPVETIGIKMVTAAAGVRGRGPAAVGGESRLGILKCARAHKNLRRIASARAFAPDGTATARGS